MNKKIIGVTVGTTMNPDHLYEKAQFEEMKETIAANTLTIQDLTSRIAQLEVSDVAILGSAKFRTMVLGKEA